MRKTIIASSFSQVVTPCTKVRDRVGGLLGSFDGQVSESRSSRRKIVLVECVSFIGVTFIPPLVGSSYENVQWLSTPSYVDVKCMLTTKWRWTIPWVSTQLGSAQLAPRWRSGDKSKSFYEWWAKIGLDLLREAKECLRQVDRLATPPLGGESPRSLNNLQYLLGVWDEAFPSKEKGKRSCPTRPRIGCVMLVFSARRSPGLVGCSEGVSDQLDGSVSLRVEASAEELPLDGCIPVVLDLVKKKKKVITYVLVPKQAMELDDELVSCRRKVAAPEIRAEVVFPPEPAALATSKQTFKSRQIPSR
ncbi:hypothetical protein B296_00044124 [Ensete ventricosum]|uniref:Uncharacterized protein n=1 Tax=Ensete ventricosum TaxID=4639 RepID=A0A426Z0Q4_ENSVE|nr:hypothetical protein B296_00044124 [Ensete ventricosum]